jgi:hypothetical protein
MFLFKMMINTSLIFFESFILLKDSLVIYKLILIIIIHNNEELLLFFLSKKGRSCYIKVVELHSLVELPVVRLVEETETAGRAMPLIKKQNFRLPSCPKETRMHGHLYTKSCFFYTNNIITTS